MALRTVRIFISSPGDVAEERLLARRLIGRLDAQFGGALQFEAILWERFPLVATASFQEQLVRPSDSDIVVVILWSRLGTPLPSHIVRPDGSAYASGTEFEFEDAIARFRVEGRPHLLTYLKTAPIASAGHLASLEETAAQKRALERFVTRWFRNADDGTLKGAFHNFATPAEFEDLLEAHLTQLAETFVPPGVARRTSAPTWLGRSPFRGLQAFEPEHAPVFFGRTAATANVLAKLRAQGRAGRAFVLIVSMSGGGKSSLVRAGVLPLLLQPGIVGAATAWRAAVMRSSDGQGRPYDALEAALLDATRDGDDGDGDGDDDAKDPETTGLAPEDLARRVVARLRGIDARETTDDASSRETAPARHVALVVDQLEEIFSDERVDAAARDAFFAALDALARCGVVWILATMRSDAYARIAEAPALVALKEGDGQFDLLPPTVREIGQIIRLPAAAAGLRFETRPNTAEKLDDVIRDDAARNPGALPLLQFLLEELYRRRSDDVLTFHAYEELGGVEGALVQRAETVLAGVSDAARDALPQVLRELVTFGIDDESRALRRVARRDAFADAPSNELIEALLDARLLVAGSSADGAPVVSLAHEALLQFWPRVKTWVDEDRELLLVHARLEAATREWERHGRRADLLLPRGKPLAEARELVAAGVRLAAAETAIVHASQRRARRFAVARNGAIAGLVVLTVAAGIAAWQATIQRGRAQVQATTAQRTTDFMVGLFSNADPYQSKGDALTVRQVLDRGVDRIERELQGEDDIRSNLLRAMGQAYTGLGLYAKARSALDQAIAPPDLSEEARVAAQLALARNAYFDGDYHGAEALYRQAHETATTLGRAGTALVASADIGLAECLIKFNRLDEAKPHIQAAMNLHDRVNGGVSPEMARDLEALGELQLSQHRLTDAEATLRRTVAMQRALEGSRGANVGYALNNLGLIYFQTGRYDSAVDVWTESLAIEEPLLGPDNADVAALLNNLGRVELLTNRLDLAQAHMTRALAIFRRALSAGHDDLVPPLNSLAMILIAKGEYAQARPLLVQARDIAEATHHPFLDQVIANEADLTVREGNVDLATKLLSQARQIQRSAFGDSLQTTERWRVAVFDLVDAAIAIKRDDIEAARRMLSRDLPVLAQQFGENGLYADRARQLLKETGSSSNA